jgi:hypothetical protein
MIAQVHQIRLCVKWNQKQNIMKVGDGRMIYDDKYSNGLMRLPFQPLRQQKSYNRVIKEVKLKCIV